MFKWSPTRHRMLRLLCEFFVNQRPSGRRGKTVIHSFARNTLAALAEIERLRELVATQKREAADLHRQIHDLLVERQRP